MCRMEDVRLPFSFYLARQVNVLPLFPTLLLNYLTAAFALFAVDQVRSTGQGYSGSLAHHRCFMGECTSQYPYMRLSSYIKVIDSLLFVWLGSKISCGVICEVTFPMLPPNSRRERR